MTQLHHIAPACVSRGIGLTHLLSVDALGLCYLTQLPHARSTLLGETPSTRAIARWLDCWCAWT